MLKAENMRPSRGETDLREGLAVLQTKKSNLWSLEDQALPNRSASRGLARHQM